MRETIWRQFGNYLKDHANNQVSKEPFREEHFDQDGTHMAWRSALGYFSGVVQAVIRRPDDASMKDEELRFLEKLKQKPEFISEIRKTMKTEMIRHSIQKGLPVIVKAKSTDRPNLKMGVRALYSPKSSK